MTYGELRERVARIISRYADENDCVVALEAFAYGGEDSSSVTMRIRIL